MNPDTTIALDPGRTAVRDWFTDVHAVTMRNLTRLKRSPDVIGFALLQPIMFVLLFSQVYGGAIRVEGSNYTEFLMAGIFAQTVIFGSTISGSYMAEDIRDGIIDRFRSLPMAPSAVLVARSLSDFILNIVSITVMLCTGFLVGWRFREGVLDFVLGLLLLLVFAWAFSWVMIFIGLSVKSPETLNQAVFIILFPLTFISNAFVPSDTLPTVLRVIAEWNPISALVQAVRKLFGNLGDMPAPEVWPMQHPVPTVLVGIAVVLLVFPPLAVRKFRRKQV
ncbi:ABC transporter permease [Tessaracoccus antarcticus]|uniref:Transport permease protein n=2 Tax=Tessaracoccus antarcticus TaxID=2479848 RepID=A0A3M0G0H1_9ACTN|nr:ABC transporter permease [Tessaracoccus antarcticus]